MPLTLERKKEIVEEVAKIAANSLSLVAAEYRGITVGKMNDLRKKARDSGIFLQVVRNTLARRAVEGTSFACAQEALTGPLVLAFSKDDPGAAARLMRQFAKENDKLQVKVLSIDGKVYGAEALERVASLPTRDEAISMLMSVMQAPISKFVQTLVAPHTKLVRTLAAVKDQKAA